MRLHPVHSFLALVLVPFATGAQAQQPAVAQGWEALPEILTRIVPPEFPARDVLVTDFGALGDGATDNTAAFRRAIGVCAASGGGRVLVPAGTFLTGPIHLRSNVNLHVSRDAAILFVTDPTHYLPPVYTRWEGVECLNYSALIYAFEQENIAITGAGVLDGQSTGNNWWSWKGTARAGWKEGMPDQRKDRTALFTMAEKNTPVEQRVFGEGHYLRPNFVQLYRCRNILIEGVTFRNSPMWSLHPVLCTNVTVRNIAVVGAGPNNDGCDPESSKDVLIENCYFDTGDDCIAIKSGRNADGRRVNVPSENIVVRGCRMKDGHGGVTMGSEITGGVRNIYVEDCTMNSPHLERAIRLKTNSVRGGTVENVFARNIRVGEVSEAVLRIDFHYEEGDVGPFTPVVRNISLREISCEKGKYAIWVEGYQRSPVENLTLQQCAFNGIEEPNILKAVKNFTVSAVTINCTPLEGDP